MKDETQTYFEIVARARYHLGRHPERPWTQADGDAYIILTAAMEVTDPEAFVREYLS